MKKTMVSAEKAIVPRTAENIDEKTVSGRALVSAMAMPPVDELPLLDQQLLDHAVAAGADLAHLLAVEDHGDDVALRRPCRRP